MVDPVVLFQQAGVPEKREVGLVAGCEEADGGGGGELGEEAGVGGAAQGGGVEGVDEEVEGGGWRVGGEVCEKGGDGVGGLGGEFGWGVGVGLGGEEVENVPEGEGWGVAIHDEDFWGVGGAVVGEVSGEGGDEFAFRAVAVETDVEGFGELEVPLGEGAGMEGVEEADGGGVRVFVFGDLVVVSFMCEQ